MGRAVAARLMSALLIAVTMVVPAGVREAAGELAPAEEQVEVLTVESVHANPRTLRARSVQLARRSAADGGIGGLAERRAARCTPHHRRIDRRNGIGAPLLH